MSENEEKGQGASGIEEERSDVKLIKESFIKPGKVVLLLQGRHAGAKAVVLQNFDKPDQKKFNHPYAYVCGISKYPKPIQKRMSKKKIERRTRFRCFVKRVGYSHIMPTRYGLDIKDFPKYDNLSEVVEDPSRKKGAAQKMHKALNEKYLAGQNQWFFTKLRF